MNWWMQRIETQKMDDKDKVMKKDGIFYYEDGTPVYTLYLENIARKSYDEIKTYFSRFGEVESVELIRNSVKNVRNRKQPKHGYVTFTRPEDAGRALNNRKHVSLARKLEVKPADKIHQRKIAKNSINYSGFEEKEANTTPEIVVQTSIMELNDDCLSHIISFLSQNEAFKLLFLSKRFSNIIKHRMQVKKFIDLSGIDRYFTPMKTKEILSSFVDCIQRLRFKDTTCNFTTCNLTRNYFKYISCFFDLREIYFESLRTIRFNDYKRIFEATKKLKSLTMKRCRLRDEVCSLLVGLTELESLNISNNRKVMGKFLKHLKSIKQLNLAYCKGIRIRHFVSMCEGEIELKELDIVACYRLTHEAVYTLIATQTELQSLAYTNSRFLYRSKIIERLTSLKHIRIHCNYGCKPAVLYELSPERQQALESLELYMHHIHDSNLHGVNGDRILLLKNLKKLTIAEDDSLDDRFLMKIAETCKLLEHINIFGYSKAVTEEGILYLVKKLENLSFLNISLNLFGGRFDLTLLNEIDSALEQKKNRNFLPLMLCIYGTIRVPWEQNDLPVVLKHIKLSFEYDYLRVEWDDLI